MAIFDFDEVVQSHFEFFCVNVFFFVMHISGPGRDVAADKQRRMRGFEKAAHRKLKQFW